MIGVLAATNGRGSSQTGSGGERFVAPCRRGEAGRGSWVRCAGARALERSAGVWRQRSPLASGARGEWASPRPPRRGERDREEGRQRGVSMVEREDEVNSSAG